MRADALTTPGQQITWTTPDGQITITVQYIRDGAYAVTVRSGTIRIEEQCASYPTEEIARTVARGYAVLAKAEHPGPATLAEMAQLGEHRQVRPTMAGAQLAEVTDPQHRALRTAAEEGRVLRGRAGESVATLKALARKGLVQLHMRPGRRYDVSHATITPAGVRELARLEAAARPTAPLVQLVA